MRIVSNHTPAPERGPLLLRDVPQGPQAPFSTHIPMRRDQFGLKAGTLARYRSFARGVREYCRDCGSHILVHGQTDDDVVAVPACTLDGDPQIQVTAHIFVKDKVGRYTIADELPQFAGWPPGISFTHREGG